MAGRRVDRESGRGVEWVPRIEGPRTVRGPGDRPDRPPGPRPSTIRAMSQIRPVPERIELTRSDDLRDVVHRAVACLAQGGLVGLPTETAYGLAASALQPGAVDRLRRLKQADVGKPMALGLKGADE